MKITAVKAIPLRCSCETIADAMSVCQVRQALLVKVETDTELYGIGEAFTFGAPLSVMQQIVEQQLGTHLIGENPEKIRELWQVMYWRTIASGRRGLVMGGISGIDIALWDLFGKMQKKPICQLLGTCQDKIPSYASGGFYAPEKDLDGLRKEVEGYLKKGYRDVKIKMGRNPQMEKNALHLMKNQSLGVSYEEDIRRLEMTRELVTGGRLIADLNAAWTADMVLNAKSDFARCGLDWLEEPIRFEDQEGCERLVAELDGIETIGYETEQGADNYFNMIRNNRVGIVQPDIGWGGGISECKKIADIADTFQKKVSLHSFGSAIHFAASLQLSGAVPNVEALESEENVNQLKTDIIKGEFEADKEMNFFVPQKPGLGIELDWDMIGKLYVR